MLLSSANSRFEEFFGSRAVKTNSADLGPYIPPIQARNYRLKCKQLGGMDAAAVANRSNRVERYAISHSGSQRNGMFDEKT